MPPVTILKPEDKTLIKKALPSKKGNKILNATVARLYVAYPDANAWTYTKIMGAVALVKDNSKNSFFFKIVDLMGNRGILWEQELYKNFQYTVELPFLHTFALDDYLAAFSFADEQDAKIFHKKVTNREKISSKSNKKSQKENKNSGGGIFGIGRSKSKIDKSKISGPTEFRHLGHIGYDEQKGFDVQNIDPEWKGIITQLGELGISSEEIEKNADFINDYLKNNNRKPANPPARNDRKSINPPEPPSRRIAPQPPTAQSPSKNKKPPPPPIPRKSLLGPTSPTRDSLQPSSPTNAKQLSISPPVSPRVSPRVSPIPTFPTLSPPAPPTLPSRPPAQQPVVAPPPPPPPVRPLISSNAPPPIPPARVTSSSIAPPPLPPTLPPAVNGRANLMEAIRNRGGVSGGGLKNVGEPVRQSTITEDSSPSGNDDTNLAKTLADALKKLNKDMGSDDSVSQEPISKTQWIWE
ncbi:10451_t:CDS:10 [Funneliformis mosseae]|uniref:10451_t:CDS:1 n=1 Tax=Funneliformis mosseae TaxID=27381 RepID=A0A9N9FCQ5_FUNMO|nr:10451_t:CDS:10 [Funneliformis mosseae]